MSTSVQARSRLADDVESVPLIVSMANQPRGILSLPRARIAEIVRHRGLFWNLVRKDFEIRYAGSALGVLWTQLYPLLQLAVYGFVFTAIFRNSTPAYPLFLFVGIILWTFFNTAVLASAGSVFANANLIKKIYFPRELAPLSIVLVAFLDLALSHVVLVAGAIYFGKGPTWSWLVAPAILLELGLLCAGAGLVVATLTVYFRDVRYFLEVGLLLLMFLSPVFYPADAVPEQARALLLLNPMATLLEMYRTVFLQSSIPEASAWLRVGLIDLGLLVVGLHIFHRGQHGFADLI